MATHSSILAWRSPWTEEEPGKLQSMGCKESDTTEVTEHAHGYVNRGNSQLATRLGDGGEK